MKIASLLLAGLLLCGVARADEAPAGAVERVATRCVSVPICTVWNKDARTTVVLNSGGAGGYRRLGEDGWPPSPIF
ncbi:MAG: hypothetical protein WCH44_09370 [Betaproteobacteria bacterium]